jgi:uncharacterized protein YegP (UPF0339 family)
VAEVDVHHVRVHRNRAGQWRAVSYGGNNEALAWTGNYVKKADAEEAALTIAAGADILVDEEPPSREREGSQLP